MEEEEEVLVVVVLEEEEEEDKEAIGCSTGCSAVPVIEDSVAGSAVSFTAPAAESVTLLACSAWEEGEGWGRPEAV